MRGGSISRKGGGGPLLTVVLLALTASGCVSDPADSCRVHSDCQVDGKRGVCAQSGFCERECVNDLDCPCGSFCAGGCGLCIVNDGTGPATCFAHERGLSTVDAVTGVCRLATVPAGDELAPTPGSVVEGSICAPESAAPMTCDADEDGGVDGEGE